MVLGIPIPDEQGEIPVGRSEGDGDHVAVIDGDAAVPAGRPLEAEGREVEEASDLVLHLILVGPVPTRRDGAIGPQNPVLPTILPLLDPIPVMNQIKSNQIKIHQKGDSIVKTIS